MGEQLPALFLLVAEGLCFDRPSRLDGQGCPSLNCVCSGLRDVGLQLQTLEYRHCSLGPR